MKHYDKDINKALKNIYSQFEKVSEITISYPDYEKDTIDYLANQGLIKKMDASTLSGWEYIVRPTRSGRLEYDEIMNSPLSKVEAFIKHGEVIMTEEYHHVTEPGLIMPDYIDGPKSNQWFSEIAIFNDRFLKNHPLHNQIADICKKHKRSVSAHEYMMGYLKALAADDDFWRDNEPKETKMAVGSRKTIEQMLAEDIERCEQYLSDPTDEASGQKLYVEITGRYDSIISGFGNGLYNYISDSHFYDPDITGDTLTHNLTVLLNKMISFQATRFPVSKTSGITRISEMIYDVFISHANKDKIEYVEQLKQSLDKLKINIFYDKDTLEWGDKWKDKILEGVEKAEFAIIVISENFFDREWTEKELNEFLNRQNSNGQKIILPILHNITVDQLTEKYPDVADIQAINSKDYSCDEIALKFAGQLIKRLKG